MNLEGMANIEYWRGGSGDIPGAIGICSLAPLFLCMICSGFGKTNIKQMVMMMYFLLQLTSLSHVPLP